MIVCQVTTLRWDQDAGSGDYTNRNHRFSDQEYFDYDTRLRYWPIIKSNLVLERGNDSVLNPFGKTTISNMVLDNTEGIMDTYIRDVWDNRLITFWKGEPDQPVSQMEELGKFRITGQIEDNGNTLTVKMRDILSDLMSKPISDKLIPATDIGGSRHEPLLFGELGLVEPVPLSESEAYIGNIRKKSIRFRWCNEDMFAGSSVLFPRVDAIFINGKQAFPTYYAWNNAASMLNRRELRASIDMTYYGSPNQGEFTIDQYIFEDIDANTNIGFYYISVNNVILPPNGTGIIACTWTGGGVGYIVEAGKNWAGINYTPPVGQYVIYPTTYAAIGAGTIITYQGTTMTVTGAARNDEIIFNKEIIGQDLRVQAKGLASDRPWNSGSEERRFSDVVYMLMGANQNSYDDAHAYTTFEQNMLIDLRDGFPYLAGVVLMGNESFLDAMKLLLDLGYCITSSRDNDLFIYKLIHAPLIGGDPTEHVLLQDEIISVRVHSFVPRHWRYDLYNKRNYPKTTSRIDSTGSFKRGTSAAQWRAAGNDYQWIGTNDQSVTPNPTLKFYPEQKLITSYSGIAGGSGPNSDIVATDLAELYIEDIIIYEVVAVGIKEFENNSIVELNWDGHDIPLTGHRVRTLKHSTNYTRETTKLLLWGHPPITV